MSPMPFSRSWPAAMAGCEITGTMVRVMRFQSSFRPTGKTGWMFRMFCVFFRGPTSKLVLFCNGRLIMSAIGFCAALASAAASLALRRRRRRGEQRGRADERSAGGSLFAVHVALPSFRSMRALLRCFWQLRDYLPSGIANVSHTFQPSGRFFASNS